MDIVRKSKNSESLCDHCRYAQDCTVYVSIGSYYDITSCSMDGPQNDYTIAEIDHLIIQKNKLDRHNKLIKDFKTKSIDEKLNIIYERLIDI